MKMKKDWDWLKTAFGYIVHRLAPTICVVLSDILGIIMGKDMSSSCFVHIPSDMHCKPMLFRDLEPCLGTRLSPVKENCLLIGQVIGDH